jgi:hypothetical protein
MKPDIFIQQKGQRVIAAVCTGSYEGLTLDIPSEWFGTDQEKAFRAIRALATKTEAKTVAYDPWGPGCLIHLKIDGVQVFSLSPRKAST